MKTIDKLITLFTAIAIFLAAALMLGCQEEVEEVITPSPEEAITSSSNVADLISRTTLRDGSKDNILDSSSCTSIVLPIRVVANGLEIIIDSEEDFVVLERIFDELEDDDDLLEFIFPITVILSDHSEIVINDEDELEDVLDDCNKDGEDDDIECVDFNYPITVNVFDTNRQIAEVITLTNDQELHDFLEDLDEDDLVSINFPITVVLSNGQQIVIDDNDELEDVIEDAKDDCDEDDNFDDDTVDDTDLVNVLTDGNWEITLFFDDSDETSDFSNYIFTFFENGTAKATNNSLVINGEWETSGDDGELELELDFGDNSPFDELDEDWDVIEFDGKIIRLRDVSGADGSTDLLTFERPTDGGNGGNDTATVSQIIVEGQWLVARYDDSGDDETSDYDDFVINFSDDGSVTATKGDDNITGTWSEITDDGIQKLLLDFDSDPFEELDDDWDIIDVREDRVELKDVSGGDGTTDILVFEKIQ